MTELKPGAANEVSVSVTDSMTAAAVGSGTLKVLATPMVAAFMEKAACELVQPFLNEGITTVGTMITVNHNAPSPVGAAITARAVLTEIDGRKYCFDLTVSDASGIIATGKHERFSVKSEKFMTKVSGNI